MTSQLVLANGAGIALASDSAITVNRSRTYDSGEKIAALAVTEPGRPNRMGHAGTFNANPVTMAAGKATMDALTPETFNSLNAAGERIRARLRKICDGLPLRITGAGSLFKISATPHEIANHRDTLTIDRDWEKTLSLELLNKGFLLTSNLQGCVSTATTDAHIDGLLSAVEEAVRW